MKFLRKLFGLDRPAVPPKRERGREFDLKGLEKVLKYQFRNPDLARTAMTHRSYLHASQGRAGESNERMEFLGDSVVGLAVNQFLYNKFPKLREGELTKMKSLLVSRVILSRTASAMGLGQYVLLSDAENESGGRNRASILADTLEGAIGAVYLDGGLEPARLLTERLLLKEVHEILSDANLANYKSMLQEYVQGEFKTHPQYRISSENGPDHHKLFAVDVVVNGRSLGRGHGSNKKEAEQEAARDALLHFEKLVRSDRGGGAREGGAREGGAREGGAREGAGRDAGGRDAGAGRNGGQRRRSRRGGRGRRQRGSGTRPDDARVEGGGAPRTPREGRPGREGRDSREPRHEPRNEGRDSREHTEHREHSEHAERPERPERPERREYPREERDVAAGSPDEGPSTGGDSGSSTQGETRSGDGGSTPWAASGLHTES